MATKIPPKKAHPAAYHKMYDSPAGLDATVQVAFDDLFLNGEQPAAAPTTIPNEVWLAGAQVAQWAFTDIKPYDTKPHPTSKEPPLELNVAAKKPFPYEKITTSAQYEQCLLEGRYVAYNIQKYPAHEPEYMECLSPGKGYSTGSILGKIAHGLFVHKEWRVVVFVPVLAAGKAFVWTGTCGRMFQEFKEGVHYQETLGSLMWFVIEDKETVV